MDCSLYEWTGRYGIWVGNQQYALLLNGAVSFTDSLIRFTVRNLTVEDSETGIFASWNWGTWVPESFIDIPDVEHRMDIPRLENKELPSEYIHDSAHGMLTMILKGRRRHHHRYVSMIIILFFSLSVSL